MEKKKEEKRCGTDLSSIVCPRRRAARGARSRVRTGPCTIQIYVYAARDVRALTGTLSRVERREVAFVLYLLRDRPSGQADQADRGPHTYVSPFRARTCVCILSEATYTTSVATDRTGIQSLSQRREERKRRE